MGRIAGWAAVRGYTNLLVVNENTKKPSTYSIYYPVFEIFYGRYADVCGVLDAITMVHLPGGPTAYFKLTSIALTKQIFVRIPGSFSLLLPLALFIHF